MSRGKQYDHTEATRASIIRAFLELYERLPFPAIRASHVAQRAHCSRNTFYRYFGDMDDLLQETEAEYSCIEPCERIIRYANVTTLEDATDWMADFYDHRAWETKVLCQGSEHERYLAMQAHIMKPMFTILISSAMDLTDMQLDYISDYIARSKASMIKMWVDKGQEISLDQVNKLSENIIESNIWTKVALQHGSYGGPKARGIPERRKMDYPWVRLAKVEAEKPGTSPRTPAPEER